MTTSTKRGCARYVLVRYERCPKCSQALDVEVHVDPVTHRHRIQAGTCPRCRQTH